jgi:hypothetical protein
VAFYRARRQLILYALLPPARHVAHAAHGGDAGQVLLAALACAVCWADRTGCWRLGSRFLPKLGALLTTIVVAAAAYLGMALLLRIGDVDDIAAAVRRRLRRRSAPSR